METLLRRWKLGDDEDYHFVLKAYGTSPYVVHIPTEISGAGAGV